MLHVLLFIVYISFISLGLPDGLLGAAWPTIYPQFDVPVSFAGMVAMTISVCTVISSLMSDRLTKRFGTGKVTALSVAATATALLGFARCDSFYLMLVWAVPYGLGAGSVDAALNNFVALHYSSRHMSWLHCMWGVGASAGPYVMGFVLTGGYGWNSGYFIMFSIQAALTAALFFTLKLWNTGDSGIDRCAEPERAKQPLSLKEILNIKGAKQIMVVFYCYCAAEQTIMLWAGSYLALHSGYSEEKAAFFAGLVFIGITAGRFLSGFMTMKLSDVAMVRIGQGIFILGCAVMLLPLGQICSLIGIALVGLGCAPIYPCLLHLTPVNFGEDKSQAVMGVQMASAYIGSCTAPPIFGIAANRISISLMPIYIAAIILLQIFMHENILKR